MEFRILGPLEVDDGGSVLPLHGARQRALLALLVLNAGQVVSDDRLLDELWGTEPPKSGRTALRVRVSQLRKALDGGGEGASSPIVTRPPGYLIRIDPEQIDARRFERLLREGTEMLRVGATEPAASTLREALALWRGPALADLAYESFAQAEAARLEGLRLTAREELAEAELALGRHAELVAELEALTGSEPLRERPRAQLMLALYRSGRAADALACYRDVRRVFVEELGIEPSPALRELERAILRHDPSLDVGAGPGLERERIRVLEGVRGGEVKLATVIACRLAAQRAAAEGRPEGDVSLAARAAEMVAAEVEEAGGRVESLGSDAIIAAFGAPVGQEDHARRALHAVLAVRAGLAQGFTGRVSFRVGVATGEVVVESDESGSSMRGRALATAAELSEAAAPGAILVGERTVAAVGAEFELGCGVRIDAVRAALEARPLVGAHSPTRTTGSAVRAPLVGRARELEALRSVYGRAVGDARPQLATVVGDAGVGKTRLARELWEWLSEASPQPLLRTGRCHQYGRGTTYRPLADVLREELGLLETDNPGKVRTALGERQILGLTLGLEVPDLHPMTAREHLHAAWLGLLNELVARRPVVLLIEDLHWCQEPLLDLLERFLDEVSGPLAIVATARPELLEGRPSWGRRRDAETIWLEPLAAPDAERMLDSLGAAAAPEVLRKTLLGRAEGNPFFLEELVSSLLDRGLLALGSRTLGGAAPPSEGAAGLVPDSVQAVLAARVDLLPDVEKAALQAAAVIGRVFWPEPVCELLGGARPEFAMLEARDFIRRRSGSSLAGEREFAFKHALTRDVAYASLPRERRARLHAAFAQWLEHVGEGRDEHASLLAHHYAEAVSPGHADPAWEDRPEDYERARRKALTWLRRAAELAVARYEIDDGIVLLEHALELESRARARVGLWRALGRASALKYDGERFWSTMQRAIDLCSDRATLAELYAELAFETSNRAGMWRQRPDRDLVDGWIARALELAAPGSAARARAHLALSYWNPEGAGDASREAVEIAERLGDPELRSYAYDARAIALFVGGRLDLGYQLEKRRFELLDRIADPEHVADIHYAPITASVWRGDFDEARQLARKHDEISAPLTAHHRIHGIAVLLELEELAGDWETIGELQATAEQRVVDNTGTPCVRNARSLLVCALANTYLGREDEACRLEACAEEMRMQGFGHVLDTPRLRLALVRGDLERAERLLDEPPPDRGWHRGWLLISTHATRLDALASLGRHEELEAWPPVEPETYLEPFLLRALGIVRGDPDLVERALAAFDALGLGWHAAETRALA
jgi:DNA-binding SARP family transcriptional activator